MPKDVKKQPQQRSKPSATAAPFEPKAKSRLDGSAPAFVPKEPTKEPEPKKAEEVADGKGAGRLVRVGRGAREGAEREEVARGTATLSVILG